MIVRTMYFTVLAFTVTISAVSNSSLSDKKFTFTIEYIEYQQYLEDVNQINDLDINMNMPYQSAVIFKLLSRLVEISS